MAFVLLVMAGGVGRLVLASPDDQAMLQAKLAAWTGIGPASVARETGLPVVHRPGQAVCPAQQTEAQRALPRVSRLPQSRVPVHRPGARP
jgi:hypothetical protein